MLFWSKWSWGKEDHKFCFLHFLFSLPFFFCVNYAREIIKKLNIYNFLKVIFDETLQECLDSYLKSAPRYETEQRCKKLTLLFHLTVKIIYWYWLYLPVVFLLIRNFDALSVLSPELVVLHENVHKRVFMTYLRMSTHKESKVRLYILFNNLFLLPKY